MLKVVTDDDFKSIADDAIIEKYGMTPKELIRNHYLEYGNDLVNFLRTLYRTLIYDGDEKNLGEAISQSHSAVARYINDYRESL